MFIKHFHWWFSSSITTTLKQWENRIVVSSPLTFISTSFEEQLFPFQIPTENAAWGLIISSDRHMDYMTKIYLVTKSTKPIAAVDMDSWHEVNEFEWRDFHNTKKEVL